MANPTLTLISNQLVGLGGASAITFSSIPATYTDLKLVMSARTDRMGGLPVDGITLKFNGSSSSYSTKSLYVNNGNNPPVSGTDTNGILVSSGADSGDATANTFSSSEVYIPNYAGSQYKALSTDGVSENSGSAYYMGMTSGLWSNTAAITSIVATPTVGTIFLQYSSFYLYGIKNN